jgi:hypothetical protein
MFFDFPQSMPDHPWHALAERREKSENSGREDANPGEQQSAPTAGRIKI